MSESARASFRSSQTLALIESSPLSSAAWEALADRVRTEDNTVSSRSLEVIIAGLRQLEAVSEGQRPEEAPARQISNFSLAMFVRLANAYNSPTLLKEVGLIYLRDLGMPEVALKHFERALLLGGPEKELRPLTEAAAVAHQRKIAHQSGEAPELSGLTTVSKKSPVATTIIRRTGKMLLPMSFDESSGHPPEAKAAQVEPMADLPDARAECVEEATREIRGGTLRRAEALLRKASQATAKPDALGTTWNDLGQAAFEAGDYPLVESAFSEVLQFEPQNLSAHFNAALGFQLNGRNEEAVQAYVKANQLHDRHPKILCNLGVLYFQMEAYPEAEKVLKIAVEVDPGYARAWDNLAAALGAQEKLAEALDAAQKASSIQPDYAEALFKIGLIHFVGQEWDKAEAELKRASLALSLRDECDLLLALIYCRQDKVEEAEVAIRRAAASDPKSEWLWMAWNDLGLARLAAGDFSRAAFAFDAAQKEAPDEPSIWINQGVAQHRAGEVVAAQKSFQRAADLNSSLADAWHNLGTICAELKDYPAAVAAFQREVKEAPEKGRAWHDLGVTLEKLGRTEQAKEAFAKSMAFQPMDQSSEAEGKELSP